MHAMVCDKYEFSDWNSIALLYLFQYDYSLKLHFLLQQLLLHSYKVFGYFLIACLAYFIPVQTFSAYIYILVFKW